MKMASTLSAFLGLAASALSEVRWDVHVELWAVRVPIEAGVRMRSKMQGSQDVENAVRDLRLLVSRGDATLLGAPVIFCGSGALAWSYAGEEIRYPTEFRPPAGPQNFNAPSVIVPEDRARNLRKFIQQFIDVPLEFETRNIGLSLEVEPSVAADGRSISLAAALQHVSLEGFREGLNDSARYQPAFRMRRTSTSFETSNGKWRLLNVNVVRSGSPAMEFFLIRVTAAPLQR